MGDDESHEQERNDAVHDLGDLHAEDVGHVKREHQQKPGSCDRYAASKGSPEDQLFAGIEPTRRWVLRLDEAAALLQPINVYLARNVVFCGA